MSRLGGFKMASVAIAIAAIGLIIISPAFDGLSFVGGVLLGYFAVLLLEELGL